MTNHQDTQLPIEVLCQDWAACQKRKVCHLIHGPGRCDGVTNCTNPIAVVYMIAAIQKCYVRCSVHARKLQPKAVVGILPYILWDKTDPGGIRPETVLPQLCREWKHECKKVHLQTLMDKVAGDPMDPEGYRCDNCNATGGDLPRAIYTTETAPGTKVFVKKALCGRHGQGKVPDSLWPLWRPDQEKAGTSTTGSKHKLYDIHAAASTIANGGNKGSSSSSGGKSHCGHWRAPVKVGDYQMLVSSAYSLREKEGSITDWPDCGVYLDANAWGRGHKVITSPGVKMTDAERAALEITSQSVIIVNWPDMSIFPIHKVKALVDWTVGQLAAGRSVDTACIGGHGRTGTFLACLIAQVEGLSGPDAVDAVRTRHCKKAIETKEQEHFVDEYATKWAGSTTKSNSKDTECFDWKPLTEIVQGTKKETPQASEQPPAPVLPSLNNTVAAIPPSRVPMALARSAAHWVIRQVMPKKLRCGHCRKKFSRDKWKFPDVQTPAGIQCPSCNKVGIWLPEAKDCPYADCPDPLLSTEVFQLPGTPAIYARECTGCHRYVKAIPPLEVK